MSQSKRQSERQSERQSTAIAKLKFKKVEEDEDFVNKTNLDYITTSGCFCYSPIENVEKMAIVQPCGHTFHEICLGNWLLKDDICPLCRSIVKEISSFNRGIESIEKFKKSFNLSIKIFGNNDDEDYDKDDEDNFQKKPPMLQRQCTIMRSITCNEVSFDDDDLNTPSIFFNSNIEGNLNGYIQRLTVLPSLPNTFENSNANLDINSNTQECIALFSNSIEYDGTTLGTFVLSSPYSEDKRTNPVDCNIIVDTSGSMNGKKIELAKEAVINAISEMPQNGRCSISIFNNTATQLTPLQQITPENKVEIDNLIKAIKADGNTEYNHAFSLISDIFNEADSGKENVNRVTVFVTDGQPSDIPDYSIIEKMIEKYPMMKLYFITLGDGINASSVATKFLCNRHPNLSIYKHCASLDDFVSFLPSIFSDVCNVFATDVKITFENVKPISSKAITNGDDSWVINIPCIFQSSGEQFAFECTSEIPRIKIEYKKNDSLVNLVAVEDTRRTLDKFKEWSIMRHINLKVNSICYDNSMDPSEKKKECEKILESLIPGEYYQEIYDRINKRIEIITMLTTRNYGRVNNNLNNSILEENLEEGSTERSYSQRISREVSKR